MLSFFPPFPLWLELSIVIFSKLSFNQEVLFFFFWGGVGLIVITISGIGIVISDKIVLMYSNNVKSTHIAGIIPHAWTSLDSDHIKISIFRQCCTAVLTSICNQPCLTLVQEDDHVNLLFILLI